MSRPALALAALVLVGLAPGCSGQTRADGSAADPGPAPEAATTAPVTSAPASPAGPSCGGPVALDDGSGLHVDGRLPGRLTGPGVPTTALPPDAGTVEVTTDHPVSGVTSPAAEVVVTRAGRVVALPLAQDAVGVRVDLRPGVPLTLDAPLSLLSCADGRPLPAGGYEVWARVAVTTDDGTTVEGVGGPWPLRLR